MSTFIPSRLASCAFTFSDFRLEYHPPSGVSSLSVMVAPHGMVWLVGVLCGPSGGVGAWGWLFGGRGGGSCSMWSPRISVCAELMFLPSHFKKNPCLGVPSLAHLSCVRTLILLRAAWAVGCGQFSRPCSLLSGVPVWFSVS